MQQLDSLKQWSGNADELAACATRLGNEASDLTVRLIRDYAQRAILSRPERVGKEAVYSFQHLVELLAARALFQDGWPLAKIAEQFANANLAEIRQLIPGQEESGNEALKVARQLMSQQRPDRKPFISSGAARQPSLLEEPFDLFSNRPGKSIKEPQAQKMTFAAKEDVPGEDSSRLLRIRETVELEVKPWAILRLDKRRLLNLNEDTARQLGDSVTKAVLEAIDRLEE